MFRLVIFKKDIKLFFSWIESCDFNITSLQSSLQYTVSKCPGGHPILHHGLKLNPNISAGKYKKMKSIGTGVSWFSTGELSKNYV